MKARIIRTLVLLALLSIPPLPWNHTPLAFAALPNAELAWSDEFTAKESRWDWAYSAGAGYKRLVSLSDASSAVEIGVTSAATSSAYSDCSLHQKSVNYTTGILEMRLRTTDDNGLTQPGKGTRGWGFWDGGGNAAWFWSASPESDSTLAGFRVQVARSSKLYLNQKLSNIDMRKWHVYRVEMAGSGTKFYVDNALVASTKERMGNKGRAELWIDNYRIRLTSSGYTKSYLDVDRDQKMYIDWVRYYELTSDLVVNTSFEVDENTDARPDGWNRTNSGSNDKRIASSLADGAYIYQMSPSSSTSTYKSLNQALNQSGKLNDIWKVAVWTRTAQTNPSGSLRVRIAFKNSAGTTKSASKTLVESTSGGYQTVSITAPQDYASMTLYLESSVVQGNIYFDNSRVNK